MTRALNFLRALTSSLLGQAIMVVGSVLVMALVLWVLYAPLADGTLQRQTTVSGHTAHVADSDFTVKSIKVLDPDTATPDGRPFVLEEGEDGYSAITVPAKSHVLVLTATLKRGASKDAKNVACTPILVDDQGREMRPISYVAPSDYPPATDCKKNLKPSAPGTTVTFATLYVVPDGWDAKVRAVGFSSASGGFNGPYLLVKQRVS